MRYLFAAIDRRAALALLVAALLASGASLVYEMVKTTFANEADWANAYQPVGELEAADITNSPILLHPGAVKYFEEQGINVPDKLKQG